MPSVDGLLGWLVSAALAFGLPAYLFTLWRAVPAVWRGQLRRPPVEDFRLFSVSARSYLSGLLAFTAWLGGFAACGALALVHLGFGGFDRAMSRGITAFLVMAIVLLGASLWAVAVPLTVLQWVVNAVNRPRLLVPPRYRGRPGSVGRRLRAERRPGALPE